jgi:MFS family permease
MTAVLIPTRPGQRTGLTTRWAVTAVFFLNGLLMCAYLVRLPSLKAQLGLSNAQLGSLGMLFAAAALLAMQTVGWLSARFGVGRVIRVALLAMPLVLAGLGQARSLLWYALAVAVLGAVHGTLDVAMNARAVAAESELGRPILSGCHAAWSISAVVSSLVGAAFVGAGVSPGSHFLSLGLAVLLVQLPLGRALGGHTPASPPPTHRSRSWRTWRAGWTRPAVALGVTGLSLMICEGAAIGWGALYLRQSRGASLAVAAVAVIAYTGSETAVRLVGDRLRGRFGDPATFRVGGLVSAAGFALAVVGPGTGAALAGLAVAGLGAGVLLPVTFGAAGHLGGDESSAIARFSTFTYAGILVGPALIGWVSQGVGLRWTLAALVPLLGCVALLTRLPRPRSAVS